jgi:hypothetical protein
MTTRRHNNEEAAPAAAGSAWARFWFAPADPFGLHVVRVATGLLMAFWLLTLAADAGSFFGLTGWFDHQAYLEASRLPDGTPKPAGWSLLYLCGQSQAAFQAAFWASLLILVLFTLGVAPRVTAVLAWLIASSFTANPAFDDEVESLFAALTLYLAFGYLLLGPWRGVSWLQRLLGPWRACLLAPGQGAPEPSQSVNVALRLLQVHLCVLLIASGLHKLQSGAWWAGVAHWYHLNPPLEITADGVGALALAARPYLFTLNMLGYATLAWQLAFPAFAWRSGWWRVLLLGGCALGWVGLTSIYRMPLFGPAFLAGGLSFVSPREWQAVRGFALAWVARTFRRPAPVVGEQRELAEVAGGR